MNLKLELPYINQNVVVLIIGIITVAVAEFYHLSTLFWIGIIITLVMIISVFISMIYYTIHYKKKKQKDKITIKKKIKK